MSYENLTRKQQELLRWMVQIAEGYRAEEEFRGMKDVVGVSSKIFLIAPDGDERIVDLEILTTLREANLISLWENPRKQDAIAITCSLRALAFEAVWNEFRKPKSEKKQQESNIKISMDKSDAMIVIGNHNIQTNNKTVYDSQQFEAQVLELMDKIRSEIKILASQERVQYEEYLLDLTKQLLSEKPEPSKIKKLISSIGFLGDIGGTVDLVEKVWPLLFQLFVLFQNMQL